MDESLLGIMEIVGPVILLIVLVWLVLLRRSNRTSRETYDATKEEYAEDEKRRREGTDDL